MRPLLPVLLALASLSCSPDPFGPHAPGDAREPDASRQAIDRVAGEPADSVTLAIESVGCFSRVAYRLTLHPDPDGARVRLDVSEASLASGWELESPARVERADLAALDDLLAYYRQPPGDVWCTGSMTLVIRKYGPRGEAVEERLVNSTCMDGAPAALREQPPLARLVHFVGPDDDRSS